MTKRQEIETDIHQAIERLDEAKLHLRLHKFDRGSVDYWTEVSRDTEKKIRRLEVKLDATPPGIPA